ncbi:MAG: hypothetical protein HY002_06135 [Candidatus Rokubacteria bacterium]|nr:hypothetical protein [Candidatus Rokubacteria bacterium]
MRPARTSAAVAALLGAAAVLLTWPLAVRLPSAVNDLGDPLFNGWILAWDLHALATEPLRLFDANIFYPRRWTLAYSDHLLGLLPLAAPVRLAGGGPLLAHNAVLFATFPLAGLTMFWLVRHLTGHAGAGLVAGVLYAFSHYRFGQLGHVQVLSHQWLPLLLLGLHRAVARGGRWPDLALAAAAFVLQALSSGYHAYFSAVAVALFAAWVAAPAARPPLGRIAPRALGAAVVAGLLLAPFFLPYVLVRQELGLVRPILEVKEYSARPASYLTVAPVHPWFDVLSAPFYRPEGNLFPGAVTLALALTGAATGLARAAVSGHRAQAGRPRWPRWLDLGLTGYLLLTLLHVFLLGGFAVRLGPIQVSQHSPVLPGLLLASALLLRRLVHGRAVPLPGLGWLRRLGWPHAAGLYVALTVVAVLCSFGPTLAVGTLAVAHPLYRQLYELVPGFDGLRVPARFAVLVSTGLSVLAGYGAAAILRRCRRRISRGVVVAVLAALALGEVWAIPLPFRDVTAPVGPADRWLATAPSGAIAVLPFYPELEAYGETPRLLGSTAHWRPLMNGYSGFFPPGYWETAELLNTFPADAAVMRLRELGVRYVVLYLGQLKDDARPRVEAALAALPPGIVQVAAFEATAILEVRQ